MNNLFKMPFDATEVAKQVTEMYKESEAKQKDKMLAFITALLGFIVLCFLVYSIDAKE